MTEKPKNITKFRLDPAHPPELTPAQAKRLQNMPIDYSDIPELPDDFWTHHPPASPERKQQITLRLDADVVEFFRAQGGHYQTHMNAVLRSYVDAKRGQKYQKPIRKAAKAIIKPEKGGKGHARHKYRDR
jgi:uncharacterized protein (DUF4415 family)